MGNSQKLSSNNLEETLKNCSKQLIEEDGKTIAAYISKNNKNGVIILSLLPYLAVYCRSAQEFFCQKIIEEDLDKQINDLRNGLKIYANRYNVGKKATLDADIRQNQIFNDKLRFSIMKTWNIHYNLGVYFDAYGHIIGDTQLSDYFLNITPPHGQSMNKHAFEIGNMLGEKMGIILRDMCGLSSLITNLSILDCPKYGYRDFNTNRKNDFFNNEIEKELNLIILHIVSTIGFVEHIVKPMLPNDNLWLFRIEYIVAHYAWSGLKRIKQHFDNNTLNSFSKSPDIVLMVNKGATLFPSVFRNCMMHYDLSHKGIPAISNQHYNPAKQLYGLVESCFDGISYQELASELRNYMINLENCLLSWFYIDVKKIKWDI